MFSQRFICGVSRDVWDEIQWAQQEAHEDSLAMESIEEQDRLEALAVADLRAAVALAQRYHMVGLVSSAPRFWPQD